MHQVRVYRPNSDMSKGGAIQFLFGYRHDKKVPAIFINAAKQVRPKPPAGSTDSPFDWKDKLTFMINVGEMAQVAAFIRGMIKEPVKFYHDSGVGKAFNLSPGQKSGTWYASLSVGKKAEGGSQVGLFMGAADLYQLLALIDNTLRYGFDKGIEQCQK